MHTLKDKVCIVTGGVSGIGGALVKNLLSEGAIVSVWDINEKSGQDFVAELNKTYGEDRAEFLKCDASSEEQIISSLEAVKSRRGGIDVVVCNAGISNESFESYKQLIGLNYTGLVALTLRAIEMMRADKGGKGGTIILPSSMTGLRRYSPGPFIYASLKCALIHLGSCLGMAPYYSITKVRVVTLCYSTTDTAILTTYQSFDPIAKQVIIDKLKNAVKAIPPQTSDEAAKCTVEAYKKAESGSTWLICLGKATDITDDVTKAFEILSSKVVS